MRKTTWIALACLWFSLALCGLSIYAEYTTAQFDSVTVDDVVAQSEHPQNGFMLGSVWWEITEYKSNPRLEPLRTYFNYHCQGSYGREAAQCLSDALAYQCAFGASTDELFLAQYDPVDSLARHAAGEPGDCVTRSGLVAAILLSVGIPARLVQLIPYDHPGHNVVSVWDEREQWIVIDPTVGSSLKTGWARSDDISETALWRLSHDVIGYPTGTMPQGAPTTFDYPTLFSGALVYPEPWLYMRTGPRIASWPFRGMFVELKRDGEWSLGTLQSVLRLLIALLAIGGLVALWRRP